MKLKQIALVLLLLSAAATRGQFAPVSTAGQSSTYNSTATIPITTTNFNNIANCLLEIHYDQTKAIATGATANPFIGGGFFVNINTPGIIILSWFTFPGVSLPDNSMVFQLNFSRVDFGTTAITWYNEGITCLWGDGNSQELIDIPTENYFINGQLTFRNINAPHVLLPEVSSCASDIVEIPVKVTLFNDIGTLNLTLWFESGKLLFHSWMNTSVFPNLSLVQTSPGVLVINGFTGGANQGITLPDSSVLFTVKFYNVGGDAYLQWNDDGPSCQFTGPAPEYFILNDEPGTLFYYDGESFTLDLPDPAGPVNGPDGGNVCPGQTGIAFSVSPIANASFYGWSFPQGFTIVSGSGTSQVTVNAGQDVINGAVSVLGMNICGVGEQSEPFQVVVNDAPLITAQPVSAGPVISGVGSAAFSVEATGSQISYQWQEFISGWNDLTEGGYYTGTQTQELLISQPVFSMNWRYYRCRVDGFCASGLVTDGTAQLFVSPPVGISTNENHSPNPIVYPNPLKSDSKLSLFLPAKSDLRLVFYSLDGVEVFCRRYSSLQDGINFLELNPGKLAPGIYFISIEISTRDSFVRYPIKCLVNNDFR